MAITNIKKSDGVSKREDLNISVRSDYLSKWRNQASESSEIINDYITRRKNQDWMSADDISNYRSALKRYKSSTAALMSLQKSSGNYKEEDEKKWNEYISSLSTDLDTASEFYGKYKTADSYKSAIAAQKEREELKTLDLDSLKKEVDNYKGFVDLFDELKSINDELSTLEYAANFSAERRAELEAKKKRKAALEQWASTVDEDDYRNKWSEANSKYNRAKYIQDGIKLANAAKSAEDFDEKSGYVSTKKDDFWSRLTGNDYDGTYEYINDVDGMRSEMEHKRDVYQSDNDWDDGVSTWEEKGYHLLTDDEVKIYNYYYATGGKDKAEEYLNSIQETLYSRRAQGVYSKLEDNVALEYLFGIEAGLDQFASGMANAFNFEDDYIPVNATQQASGMVREDLADKGFNVWYNFKTGEWEDTIFGSSVGQVAYDSITTTANMLPSILTSAAANFVAPGSGAIIGAGMMGTSAAGNAYQEMLNLGYDKGQARTYSTLVGISEAGLQYVLGGISQFGGKVSNNVISKAISGIDNGLARFAIQLGGSVLSEGFEEGLQEIINPLLKNAILHADEDIDWSQVAYSALLGSLSAFGLEGPGVIANNVSRSLAAGREGKSIVDNGGVESLVALANEMAGVSEEYGVDLSKRVGRVNGKKGVNSKAVGYLSMAVNDVRVQQNKADIVKALESKGISSRKAQRYADILASNNYELGTVEEWQNATGDADSYNVIRSVMDSSVDTRNAKYGRARVGVKTADDGTVSLSEERAKKVEEAVLGSKYAEEADSIEATVSKDGKAKVISTDTEVTLQGIDHIETEQVDGKETDVVYLKVADADGTESTVAWSDVEFANRTEAVLYESFVNMGLDPEHFDAYIKNFNEADFDASIGEAAIQYAHGFANAYRYGWANLESEVGSDVFASKLNETARNIAYTIGKEAVTNNTEAKQAALDIAVEARKASGKGKSRTKGKFHMADSIKTKPKKNFTRMQQAGIGLAKRISELGIDVYLYESQYVNGQYVDENGEIAANGFFRAKDGSIHIDINAGDRGQGLMTFAIAHELVHYMRVHSPKKFKAFADLLFKWYGEKGKSVNELIEQRMAEENLSWDDAYEEVVARSCESFLTDSNIADRIIELQQTDKGLWETIRDKVLEFLDWMKSLFKDVDVESEEGRFVREFKGEIDHLYDAFYNTLADAVETHQWVGSIAEAKTNAETLATAGITVDADTSSAVMNSVRYAPKTQAEIDKVAKALSESLGVSIEKAKAWVKSETSLASIILAPSNAMFLDYEADDRYEAIKKNAEYPQGTVDFSNLCKKRREFTALLDKLQREHPNRIITAEEMEQIRQILIEENVEVACGLCYVEERRQLLGEIAQGFIDGYKNGTLKESIAKGLDASDTYVPTIYDLITYDGYRALTTEHPSIAEAFKKYNNARGMQAGRLIEGIAEYKREILSWSQKKVDFVNSVGGLRVFSFSDFEATHLIDLVQVIQDCAAKGVMIQAYTKVPAFANAVKDTHMKVNRSLIAKGTGIRYESGRMVLDLDPVEGIDIHDKDFFDSTNSESVGNVLVGMSDEQIRLAMKTPFVDYIIPFHTGLKKDILKAKKIDHWDNYKNFQTDKDIVTGKVAKNQINVYVDVIQAAEAEGKPIRNKVDFVNKFLAVAKERGLKPRFWQFLDVDANGEYVYTEGYHKFLVDFKLFDKYGNILPQKPVVPVFDDALNARILSEYVAGKKAPVSRDAVYDRLEREVINGGVKKSTRKSVATYTEAQYNAFGWASYNGVITAKERQILFSRYADFKHNRNKYPVTRWGEAVIHSTECPDVIMYVKGSIESPDVTRIIRIKADESADVSAIQERIVANEFEQKPLPYESVEAYYGEEYLEFHRKQDYASFRQYQDSIQEGRGSQESHSVGEGLQDGEGSGRSGGKGDRADGRRIKKSSRRDYAKVDSKAVMTADRIDDLIEDSGAGRRVDYANYWITSISPTDFLNMTTTPAIQDRSAFDKFPSEWNDDATMDTYDYLGELKRNRQTPYLAININTGEVMGHEGRHRIRALEREGIKSVEIVVEFKDDDYRIVKYSPDGKRLRIKDAVKIINQFGTGQTASITNIIPLNEDYRDTILANYGEATSTSDDDIRYSKRVIPTGIELPDGTKVDKDGKPRSAQAQRDAGYMLSESKFYQLYSAHKLNFGIKSRGWDLDYVIENIRRNGFISTTSIGNVVPSSLARYFRYDASGNVMFEHIVQQRYAPRKGDTVMFVPNNYVDKYDIIKNGFMPLDYEIAVVEYDYQPYYELYTRAYDSAYEKANGGIRYQRRGTGMSNRSILADALESATQNDSEARRLAEYKEKIDLINAEEEKLREVRARIAELSFASGPKDTATISRLQETATRIASRINTYDKQLLRLEATAPLIALLEREKAAVRKREKERTAEALARYREKSAKTIREVMTRNTESRKRSVESRKRTVVRNKIKRVVTDLNGLLNRGTKERNVKTDMRETVGSALRLANVLFNDEITNEDIVLMGSTMATEEEQKLLEQYRELIEKRDSAPVGEAMRYIDKISVLNRKLADLFKRERARLNQAKVSEAVDELAKAYAGLKVSDKDYVSAYYSEEAYQRLMKLSKDLGGTVMKDMSLEQLEEVYNAYKMIRHIVRESNSLFRMGKTEDLAKRVAAVQGQILSLYKEREKDPRGFAKKYGDIFKGFVWNEMKPLTAFETLGAEAFTELFWDAIKAEAEWAKWMKESKAFLDEQREKYGYKSWDMEAAHEFTLPGGKVFRLTVQDMMSIYAYSKRDQAEEHMTFGGFQFADYSEYKDDEGVTRVHSTSDLYVTDWTTIGKIIGALTDEQKHYVDAVQQYLTDMGERGNEVSEILYGIGIFNETAYFPLMSAKDYLSSVEEALNATPTLVSLKNTGMTQQTAPHASNPIILQGFDDVAIGHIDKMAKYCTHVLPIENLRRVFDSVTATQNGGYVSTKAVIERVFGKGAQKYIEQYITDLNGGVFVEGPKIPAMAMFSKFKATAVGASLSVVVQQPFAVIRAMDVIDPKHFVGKVDKAETKRLYDEIMRYAPVAIIKEMGGFDVGSSRTARDYLGSGRDKGILDKVNDVAMYGAGWADRVGWGIIWNAVKREVASEGKYELGSEEYLKACGERFTEVIVRTQVYDSVNSRSGIMRSKSDIDKFMTSFMGEPTTVVNQAYLAMLNLGRAKGKAEQVKAKRKLGRTMGVLLTSTLLTTLAKSFIYAMRDDEDDESLLERWAYQFTDNLKSDLNPLSMFPYARDIVSLLEGWDVERPDMTLVANVITSAKRLLDDGATIDETIAFFGDVANVFGVPAKNLIRDAKAIYNLLDDIFDDVMPTDVGGEFVSGFTGEEYTEKTRAENAFKKGDNAEVKRIVQSMIKAKVDSGKTEKEAKSAVRSSFTSTYKEQYVKAYKKGDLDEMNRIRKYLHATGLYGSLGELDASLKKWRED